MEKKIVISFKSLSFTDLNVGELRKEVNLIFFEFGFEFWLSLVSIF